MNINQNNVYGNNNINIGTPARHLDSNSKQQLKNMLGEDRKVRIAASLGDSEAHAFAEEMKTYLVSEGYEVQGINHAVFTGTDVKGQSISPNSVNGFRDISIGHI